jgi:hypothetical protein
MGNEEEIAGWRHNATLLSPITLGLNNFLIQILSLYCAREGFDIAALMEAKEECLRQLKNFEVAGMSIDDEAKMFRQALSAVERLIDGAITEARKR